MVKKINKQTHFNGHTHGEKHNIFKVQNNGLFVNYRLGLLF